MVLIYNGVLPPGALVRTDTTARPLPAPVWLSADAADLGMSASGRAISWAARGIVKEAMAVAANREGNEFTAGSLRFKAETNGGFLMAQAVPEMGCVSLGLIFHPGPGDARTLMTLRAPGSTGYIFLDAQGGVLRLAQKGGDLLLTMPLPGDGPVLVLCSLSQGMARLAVNAAGSLTAPVDPAAVQGPADVFIGCRGARAGLRNKLGSFRLSDLLIWPGQDCFASPEALSAVRALWTERTQSGI